MIVLPFRQVHLDFHTSEHIAAVGARFKPEQFQRALKLGRVNSITVFAKCHHGWSYYPTRVGRRHPHLRIDLLGRQIAACRRIGVRAPIYYTVGWSAADARRHPEWTVRRKDGSILALNCEANARPDDPRPSVSWQFLCPSGAYKRHILEQTDEICRRFPVDGLFYDICNIQPCWCDTCLAEMKAAGLNPDDEADVRRHAVEKTARFMADCRAVIGRRHPQATVFFNGLAKMDTPDRIKALQTHFELEDLPTTWGGYDKFPPRARYYGTYGKPMLAMSGKFHTQWGEFGGYKHRDAIRFEAGSMLAFGAACSFGDQLHPSGEMDLATYRNIGHAYQHVRKLEAYTRGARPFANLAIVLSGEQAHDQGVANMLMESQLDFEVIRPTVEALDELACSRDRYRTVILPGGRFVTAQLARLLGRYLAGGGSLLVLGHSALAAESERVALDIGCRHIGPARYELDYLVAGRELARDLPAAPFVNYVAAPRFAATTAKVLARIHEPYFNRTYRRYCSHMNTPYRPEAAAHGGAFQNRRVVFLPHGLGALYHDHGARVHRQLFINALRRIYRGPVLKVALPSAGRVSLLHQPDHRRYIAHLLYSPPLQRGRCVVIEDFPPLRQIPLELRVDRKVRSVELPLAGQKLSLRRKAGAAAVVVPEVVAHQVVVFNY